MTGRLAERDRRDGRGPRLWREIKALFWFAAVFLGVQSAAAQQYFIPSESMMPGLVKGDRLLVSKYPYGWSWASVPYHLLPEIPGRLAGRVPRRGDVVTLTPPGRGEDWIKRVIGLPGDTVAVVDGRIILNGRPVPREERPARLLPIDANVPCDPGQFGDARVRGRDGRLYCRVPIFRETMPDGASYDTADVTDSAPGDNRPPVRVPAGHLFLMGDNRDNSADSRVPAAGGGLGGPVPWDAISGRAEMITFSVDGTADWWNPLTWPGALRTERAGSSLRPEGRAHG